MYTYNIYISVFICYWNKFKHLYVYFWYIYVFFGSIYIFFLFCVCVAIRLWKLIDPATWSNDRPPNVLSWIVYYIQYFSFDWNQKVQEADFWHAMDQFIISNYFPSQQWEPPLFSSRQVWQRAPSLLDENSTAVAVSPQCAYALASLSQMKEMIFVGDFHWILLAISMGWRCIYIARHILSKPN